MFGKKLTFMLIPNARGILKQISIPVFALYISGAAAVVLLLVSLFFSAQFFSDRVASHELERLRTENEALTEKFEQMRWTLSEVESRYDELIEKEVYVRTVFDLPAIDEQERRLGIGGPVSPAVAVMSDARKVAYTTEVELDRLLRLSRFELEKYGEVETALLDLKDRLDHTPSIWPAKGWQSRGYGMKFDPFTGYKRMHRGIDIANRRGTQIIAAADGKVVRASSTGGLGKMVVINHGYGLESRYAHLSQYKVKVGQRVKRGEVVGLMGSTGYSTGPHLHYEVRRNGKAVNPIKYILNEM
ncbi:MAG: M23 family metallopeptidase [candidate division Zixibacteria bacterium]|nr:M23 family metallopeptidase [candidate division Zixibacteria bacterium]